jgi:hypothetical protein
MAGNGSELLGNGWEWLGMVRNGWESLRMAGELLGMAGNGSEWLGNGSEWLGMVRDGWKWLEMAGMAANARIVFSPWGSPVIRSMYFPRISLVLISCFKFFDFSS